MGVELKITPRKTISTVQLGKRITLGAKSLIHIDEPGTKFEWEDDTAQMTIGIGKDHIAFLTMSREALEALQGGAEIHIKTLQEHIQQLKQNGSKRKK